MDALDELEGPPAKRARRETGPSSQPQVFSRCSARENSRAHFGNQIFYGPVSQSFSRPEDPSHDGDPASLRAVTLEEALVFDGMDTRRHTIKLAHGNTCRWLFERPEYRLWRDDTKLVQHHGFFWIRGKPGAGKSTLMKRAAMHAEEHIRSDIVVSFFFNARGARIENSVEGMYRSLLHQLLKRCPRLEQVCGRGKKEKHQSWPIALLQEYFRNAVLHLGSERLTCYVDALDECDENDIRDMIEFFEDLGSNAASAGTHFRTCLSSRHYPRISITKCVHLVLDSLEGHHNDMVSYVESTLKVSASLRDNLSKEIGKRAHGVFLWVVLAVRILNKECDRGNAQSVFSKLDEIPGGVHALFEDAILERGKDDTKYLKSTLLWTLFSKRPLTPSELYHAVLTADSTKAAAISLSKSAPPDLQEIESFILNASKGLVSFSKADQDIVDRVQFIHETVREYLLSTGIGRLDSALCSNPIGLAHDLLKHQCHEYIEQALKILDPPEHLLAHPWSPDARSFCEHASSSFPLLGYVSDSLVYHSELAQTHGVLQDPFLEAFPLQDLRKWNDLRQSEDWFRFSSNVSKAYIFTIIDAPALLEVELRNRARDLVQLPRFASSVIFDYNDGDTETAADEGYFGTPLQAAAATGRERSFEMLIESGARIDAFGGHFGNALQAATHFGRGNMVDVLLKREVPVNAIGGFYGTALQAAAESGNQQLVTMLLEHGADPNILGEGLGSSLYIAALWGYTDIVEQLLEHGAEVNAANDRQGSALSAAARNGHLDIVRILLEYDADVNLSVGKLGPGLQVAAANGHVNIVKELLGRGAKINASNDEIGTALQAASRKDRLAVVQHLLEAGADVDASHKVLGSALEVASGAGSTDCVEELLDHGAIVMASGDVCDPALIAASDHGHTRIVGMLLKHGAEVNSGKLHSPALELATAWRHKEVVQLLVRNGAILSNPLIGPRHGRPLPGPLLEYSLKRVIG